MPLDYKSIINNILDINTIDTKRYVAPWRQSRWITLSSMFFLLPSIYGFANKEYALSSVGIITSLCSINYWRDASYSWRRTVDIIMAKISFTVFIITGPRQIIWRPFIITGYSGTVGMLYCYYMSNKHSDSELWWKYHMMFHLCVAYTQFITIKSIIDNKY
jgi:hypothetical protein